MSVSSSTCHIFLLGFKILNQILEANPFLMPVSNIGYCHSNYWKDGRAISGGYRPCPHVVGPTCVGSRCFSSRRGKTRQGHNGVSTADSDSPQAQSLDARRRNTTQPSHVVNGQWERGSTSNPDHRLVCVCVLGFWTLCDNTMA